MVSGSAGEELSTREVFRRGGALLARSLRAMPGSHAIALTGAITFSVAAVLLTRVLAWITDEVIVPGLDNPQGIGSDRIWAGVGLIVAVGLLRGAGAVVRRYFLARARYGTEVHWRRQLFDRYLRLPMVFHRSRSTGELLAHADNDLTVASMMLMPFAFAVATVVLLVVALISLLLIHPLLALVAVVLFPILAVMNHFYTRRVHVPAAEAQDAVGEVSAIAHESFDGALVVKALGREAAEVERLRVAGQRLRDRRVDVGRLRAVFEPAIEALPNIGIVGLLLLGSSLVDQGSISIGDLVGAMTLFSILALPVRIVGFFLEEMPRSVVALARVDKVLDIPTDQVLDGTSGLPHGPLGVEFDAVVAGYGIPGQAIDIAVVAQGQAEESAVAVLDGISFDVAPGESVAIVGATGGGKSTLAQVLAGLHPTKAGAARIGGVPVADLEESARTSALAIAFQETFLFADSIVENVRLSRAGIDDEAATEALRIAGALDFVKELPEGIHTVVGERGVTLSGGQRQRIALARALAGEPRVLFLDDATSAVDPVVEAHILGNLRESLDLTLLVVAHRLSTIRLADRVVFIADGRVAGTGSHDELMSLPGYEALARAYEIGAVA